MKVRSLRFLSMGAGLLIALGIKYVFDFDMKEAFVSAIEVGLVLATCIFLFTDPKEKI